MANENTFDPQTRRPGGKGGGQFLDKVTRHMLDTRLQADTLGEGRDTKELTKMGLLTGMDTSTVQAYVTQAINLVRKYNTSAADLKNLLPLLDEIQNNAQQDVTLSDTEKKHILQTIRQLRTFVSNKLRLTSKLTGKLKGIAREKTQKWKDSLGQNLKDSSSVLFRLAGRALSSKTEGGPAQSQQDALEATAKNAALFGRSQGKGSSPKAVGRAAAGLGAFDDDDDVASMSPRRTGGGGVDAAAGGVLNKILATDKQIHTAVKEVKTALVAQTRQDANQYEQDDKERERLADNNKAEKKDDLFARLAALFGQKKGTGSETKARGIFDTFGDLLKLELLRKLLPLVESVFAAIKAAAMTTLSGIATFATAAAVPALVLAAQALLAEKLASIFNDVRKMYPELGEGGKTAKDTVKAVAEAPKNIQTVLEQSRTETGNVTKGSGGKLTPEEWNERRQMGPMGWGMSQDDYMKAPDTLYAKRMAEQAKAVAANPITTQVAASASASAPEPASLAPIRLQDKLTSVGPTTSPTAPAKVADPKGAKSMRMSDAGFAALIKREGVQTKAYWDVNGWAIGIGQHNFKGKPVYEGQTAPKDELIADARQQIDGYYSNVVKKGLTRPIPQAQFDSLVSVAWNLPGAALKLARKVDRGEQLTPADFGRSATVEGKTNAGLVQRRAEEFSQFNSASASLAPTPAPVAPNAARSGATLASATMAAGGGRAGGASPTIVVNSPVSTMAQSAAPAVIPIPLRVDPTDATVRAIRNTSGNVLG